MSSFYTRVERFGNKLFVVEYEDGLRNVRSVGFKPTLYLPAEKSKADAVALDGTPVGSIRPGSMRECKEFMDSYGAAGNVTVYGFVDYEAQYISERWPHGCEADINAMRITFIDIEVVSDEGFPDPEHADWPITAITLMTNKNEQVTFGLKDVDVPHYVLCKNEVHLLAKFISWWSQHYPDIITGWHSKFFDIKYIINRIKKLHSDYEAKQLSIHGIIKQQQDRFEGTYYEIMGTTQLDYMHLFKKFGVIFYGNQESYKLDHIAHTILGERKLDYSEHASLNDLYEKDPQKYYEYNIKDTGLVKQLDHKLGYIALALALAHKAGVNYDVVFGSTRIWDTFIYNFLRRHNVVVPPPSGNKSDRRIEGAYVKEPHKGMSYGVCSFDLNSLYPHIIMQYNMSPETAVWEVNPEINVERLLRGYEVDIPKDRCLTATGQYFDTSREGIFPMIVDKMYSERSEIKKRALALEQEIQHIKDPKEKAEKQRLLGIWDNEQLAIKIMMNSLYGAMSNQWFRYFDNRIAEAITVTGQLTIRWAEKAVNQYLNKVLGTEKEDFVIAIDTDSLYISFEKILKKAGFTDFKDHNKVANMLDKIARDKIEPVLEKAYDDLQKYLHAPKQRMFMKREIIATNVVFTGKKRYIANVIDKEGVRYDKPKLKITGIESVRSSTPWFCRKIIEETLDKIMNNDEKSVQDFINEKREEFLELPAEDVAFPRGVTSITKYKEGHTWKSGTPIHVRASIVYNNTIKEKGLDNKYEMVYNNDKILWTYMTMPNPVKQNVFGFKGYLPRELGLEKYIDYDMQFDKAYLEPIQHILSCIGWTSEKVNTLESFFN